MASHANQSNRELLSHMTKSSPYAIHRTEYTGSPENALYLHWHPEAEFFFLLTGELDFFVEDTCYPLKAGEAMFIPPNLLHHASSHTETMIIFQAIVFSTDLIVPPSDSVRFKNYIQPVLHTNSQYALHLSTDKSWQQSVLTDLQRIFSASNDDVPADLLTEGLLRAIWQEMYRFHLSELVTDHPHGKMQDLMQHIITYMQQHYQEELTLQTLANTIHISEGQLCRSFKQMTGSTPFTWLKKYRILKSCELLITSDKKISEICCLCGFNNISYYNREFLRIMKTTPSEYRKNILHQGDGTTTR